MQEVQQEREEALARSPEAADCAGLTTIFGFQVEGFGVQGLAFKC